MRFFNTAGPVNCKKHYCLPPLSRFNLNEILTLIDRELYFVLHAPRQVGKTTYLLALMDYLNQQGKYRCLYINVEVAQTARENVEKGMQAILNELASQARTSFQDEYLQSIWPSILARSGEHTAFGELLTLWAEQSDKPLILLIDEIDSLVGNTLISVLRQLRAGYIKRPALFPQSVVLCGVRDVRDYRIHIGDGKDVITGGSAFNIKAESLRMGDFKRAEVETLYQQHSTDTGQQFDKEALALVWELTQGQPWLVNALGYELCFKMGTGHSRTVTITADMVIEAKEQLIQRRATHLDQLAYKLNEERVRRVISPMLRGDNFTHLVTPDDIYYLIDLGLVKRGAMGLQIANPIYNEIIPRELNFAVQLNLENNIQPVWYIAADGSIDMTKLLTAFQQFFREDSEHWVERFEYKKAGPQLLMQAFLQRIVNGGGRVEREYGLGRRRTDLLIIWPYGDKVQKVVIELKIRYGSLKQTVAEGLQQSWDYMDRCGTTEGHLVIFDRDATISWADKIFMRTEQYKKQTIQVWGM